MSLPTSMNAIVIDGKRPVLKSGLPLPQLGNGKLLLKTRSVAARISDWKILDYNLGQQGSILGTDVVGEVVKIGDNVDTSRFRIGDNVFGFVHGANFNTPDNGAFAQYVALDSELAFKLNDKVSFSDQKTLDEGPINTFEGAATVPCSWITAGATLFHHMKLKFEWEPKQPQIDRPVLVWGGATGLGQAIIQLLKKIHGFNRIIVVASKKHEQLLTSYGADEVFDYHDKDVIEQIRSKYNDFSWLVDCVSSPETFNQVYQCSPDGMRSTVFNFMMLNNDVVKPEYRKDTVNIDDAMVYSSTGVEYQLGDAVFPAVPEYRNDVAKFVKFINPYLLDGSLRHNQVKIYKGLENAVHMLDELKANSNSNDRYVVDV
ncbi:hypothetical protein MOSE0_C02586 [Monosporozyma servazzii]